MSRIAVFPRRHFAKKLTYRSSLSYMHAFVLYDDIFETYSEYSDYLLLFVCLLLFTPLARSTTSDVKQ